MHDLPEADEATRAGVLAWMARFAAAVRAVDYRTATPMWHAKVLAFGTHQAVLEGFVNFRDRQWDSVWPRTADFAFVEAAARVLASADAGMAVAIAPFTSTGFHADGTPFPRPGRATLVLMRQGDAWIAVHSHLSLERGVPTESHGNRPVIR
ncbi:nuclear transport factor 2 family protein [Roseomonas stagni]|uniref:Nuclear transport factor 2 family protein n=1 Tax=Falsiroseomonas algicola TaxID=2716930 RepID=A0A6M1LRQ3_9PROT|nr:nuclear transport factor 2 family protein [Falsiroseomonas algicola]NGM23066.1 nuclear transport factor 2 family protein [Falsiroseomonas algicola]